MKFIKPKTASRVLIIIASLAVIVGTAGSQPQGIALNAADSSGALTMQCDLTPGRLRVTFTGPVQEGVLETRIGQDIRIEFGSDRYSWSPYLDGRNWVPWRGDWDGSTPREYTIDLPADVGRFNLFLYDAWSGGEVSWFDVNQWDISGDCWGSGGGIDYDDSGAHDPSKPRISCEVKGDEMVIDIYGDVRDGLFDYAPADQLIYLEYGAGAAWDSYISGKALTVWNAGSMTHQLVVPSHEQDFNLFLYGRYSGLTRWFDLDEWSVDGDCWRDSDQDIKHIDANTARKNSSNLISCSKVDGLITYRIEGNIEQALATPPAPTGNVLLQYGGTDGWSPYESGKSMATWSPETMVYELTTPEYVDQVNFYLYSTDTKETSWFMLDYWKVEGDCSRESGQDISHKA